jgi:predicted metalloprotease
MGGLGSIIGGMGALGKGGGVIGIVVALVIVFLGGRALTGGGGGFDVGDVLEDVTGVQAAPAGQSFNEEAPDPQTDFIIFVFNDTQSLWEQQLGQNYQPAELVLFSGFTQSACGGASSGVGPHYCPADGTVRIDNDFFRELSTRFGAPGDFAQAYVIAHEMGHHVQNVTGISGQVHEEERNNPDEANELSVRLELQADCLAGVWAHQVFARGDLEAGDIDEALAAAAAVGDDTIQQQATGTIDQDTWTHGSAEQRSRWFTTGYESGDPASCDTF